MASEDLDFEKYTKEVLEDELERQDALMTNEQVETMLQTEDNPKQRTSIVGYPSYPLYKELAFMLREWMLTRVCPALNLPKFDLLDEQTYAEARITTFNSIFPMLEGLGTLWTLWSDGEIKYRIREILNLLQFRGILDLLGIRKTVGTVEMLLPSRQNLKASFDAKHHANSDLSVGARALSKHFHRDQTTSWWGNCTGTEAAKNEHALGLFNKILDNAVWINIHWLPHDVYIIEVRQDQGYGVRWSADGSNFRGFLEPYIVDGHEVGWKH